MRREDQRIEHRHSQNCTEYGSLDNCCSTHAMSQDNESTKSSKFPPSLIVWVPEVSPKLWVFINTTLALSGCVLILEMVYARQMYSERTFANGFQKFWEFATCLFWTLETSLSTAYQKYHLQHVNRDEHCRSSSSIRWYTKLEIVIALYFFTTTLYALLQWRVIDPIGTGMIWETSIDTSFYVYLSIRNCFRSNSTEEEDSSAKAAYQLSNCSRHDICNGGGDTIV